MRVKTGLRGISFLIHPLLFGIFPVLFLYAFNIDQVRLSEIVIPLGLILFTALVLLLITAVMLHDNQKGAFSVSILLILFFSYGHFLEILKGNGTALFIKYGEGLLFAIWLFILLASIYLIARTDKKLDVLTNVLNVIALSLILISLFRIALYEFEKRGTDASEVEIFTGKETKTAGSIQSRTLPDIYYIILDGYACSSTLEELYNYKNDEFIDYLEIKGFFIASGSRSNYSMTSFSLASSLNMEYINYLADEMDSKSRDVRVPYQMIKKNRVMQFLRLKGYRFIHFRSGWGATKSNEYADQDIDCGKIDEFRLILIKTTVLVLFTKAPGFLDLLRKRILKTFDEIPEIAKIEEPTFTFAHLTTPHPPYLFDRNGLRVPDSELRFKGDAERNRRYYLNQLIFVNKRVTAMVDAILSDSNIPPIIVLQADHGTASLFYRPDRERWGSPTEDMLRERFCILNAYLLPGRADEHLYKSISPVNTFRLIFNLYFNAGYELLNDRSYYSSYHHPYQFSDVTEEVKYR